MHVFQENCNLVVLIELADAVWLLLREQQAAVAGGDDAIGVIGALPCEGPLGSRRHHSWDSGYGNFTWALGLCEAAPTAALLLRGDARPSASTQPRMAIEDFMSASIYRNSFQPKEPVKQFMLDML